MSSPSIHPSRRFGGVSRLYGAAGADAISRAHVAVAGIGGDKIGGDLGRAGQRAGKPPALDGIERQKGRAAGAILF